mmetsp:Transcript_112805/g.318972  ORF Transcript_112805/g.318972 Transcript_112805/m.318972 type:complete len:370 (-) Transcript_112805:64-1173(-)
MAPSLFLLPNNPRQQHSALRQEWADADSLDRQLRRLHNQRCEILEEMEALSDVRCRLEALLRTGRERCALRPQPHRHGDALAVEEMRRARAQLAASDRRQAELQSHLQAVQAQLANAESSGGALPSHIPLWSTGERRDDNENNQAMPPGMWPPPERSLFKGGCSALPPFSMPVEDPSLGSNGWRSPLVGKSLESSHALSDLSMDAGSEGAIGRRLCSGGRRARMHDCGIDDRKAQGCAGGPGRRADVCDDEDTSGIDLSSRSDTSSRASSRVSVVSPVPDACSPAHPERRRARATSATATNSAARQLGRMPTPPGASDARALRQSWVKKWLRSADLHDFLSTTAELEALRELAFWRRKKRQAAKSCFSR